MRKLLLLALPLITFGISAKAQQPKYSNRWKETSRLDSKKKPVDYLDTFYINKIDDKSIYLRYNGFMYVADIIKGKANFTFKTFTVSKNNKKEVVLKDTLYTHVFSPEPIDRTLHDIQQSKGKMDMADKPVENINTALLNGVWDAYKRENKSGPSAQLDFSKLIRTFAYNNDSNIVVINKNYANEEIFLPQIDGSNILSEIENGLHRKLTVWKLDENELIMEDQNGIIYYFKKFR